MADGERRAYNDGLLTKAPQRPPTDPSGTGMENTASLHVPYEVNTTQQSTSLGQYTALCTNQCYQWEEAFYSLQQSLCFTVRQGSSGQRY